MVRRARIDSGTEDNPSPAYPRAKEIICYKKAGLGYAVSESDVHTGGDVLDAAQSAVNSLSTISNTIIYIKNGSYAPSNRLVITEQGAERFGVVGSGYAQTKIDTSSISSGAAIEINPNSTTYSDRVKRVRVGGFEFVGDKGADGIFVKNPVGLEILPSVFKDQRIGLRVENAWNWECYKPAFANCGSTADGVPAFKIGDSALTSTDQATNHGVIYDLQADPEGTPEHAWVGVEGEVDRLHFETPSPELGGGIPGWLITDAGADAKTIQVNGGEITGGSPCFDVQSSCDLYLSGAVVRPETSSVRTGVSGAHLWSLGNTLYGDSSAPAIDMENGWVISHGDVLTAGVTPDLLRGIDCSGGSYLSVKGTFIRDCDEAGIRVQDNSPTMGHISGVTVLFDGSGDAGILLDNASNIQVSNIVGYAKNSSAVVEVGDSSNIQAANVLPLSSASAFNDAGGNTGLVSNNTLV